MLSKAALEKRCIGCGLCCEQNANTGMHLDSNGFYRPQFDDIYTDELRSFCPVMVAQDLYDQNIWGAHEEAFLGYSKDEEIRKIASSGGCLTQIVKFLFDRNYIDAVYHVAQDQEAPFLSHSVISASINEVIEGAGSRYIALPYFEDFEKKIANYQRIAFIGKPCDIKALNSYAASRGEIAEKIVITLSFFCAGIPSVQATMRLLDELDIELSSLRSLRYRGKGWPGSAAAISDNGSERSMSYDESWGKILGRDLEPFCRFCFDGVGECADISAGDAWYLIEGKPSFGEALGRNIIFGRTKKGLEVLKEAEQLGYLDLEPFADWVYLQKIQDYQYSRKATLYAKSRVLQLLGVEPFPYDKKKIKKYGKHISKRRKIRNALGIAKRILGKRIDL